jgi:transposase
VIVSKEGISLVEITLPNNKTDAKVAQKLIKKLKRVYRFKKNVIFIADAGYDEKDLYQFIVNQLKCQAFIPINPRNTKPEKSFGPKGLPVCDANFEMKSNGICRDEKRERIKFRCPLKTNRKFALKHPKGCPVKHHRFFEGKRYGCTKYIDITNDARAKVPRDSILFKQTYKLRTEVERYFSRLGNRDIEQTTHYNRKAIKNQITIAHLTLSLVAYTAAIIMKNPDKIRCFRTFAKPPRKRKQAA